MAIDPMMYQRLSGRKGDPYTRMGEALAKNAEHKQERDALPKGVSGGLKVTLMPGTWLNIFYWFKSKDRTK
jgi:hypothetical protein